MAKPYFTRQRRISLKKTHIVLVDKCVLFSGWGTGILNPELAASGRVQQAAPTRWNREACLQLAPGFSSPIPQAKRKPPLTGWFSFGWGTGIRTPEMSESESDALPLGDAPIFSTDDIIADSFEFVNRFFEKRWNFFKIFFAGKTGLSERESVPCNGGRD